MNNKFNKEELLEYLEKHSYVFGMNTHDLGEAIDFLVRFELLDPNKFHYEQDSNSNNAEATNGEN